VGTSSGEPGSGRPDDRPAARPELPEVPAAGTDRVGPTPVAIERMFAGILGVTHLSTPDMVADALAEHAAGAGLRHLGVYLCDLEQEHLVPLSAPRTGAWDDGVLRIEGTVAGRCFATARIIELDAEDVGRRQLWVPLMDGTERIGVMVLNVPAADGRVDTRLVEICERYAHLAAQLVLSKGAYGDLFERARRRQPMSVAAELQRHMLPPMTVATQGLVIAGVMEPCYRAGGDSFDYAVNGTLAHLAIFDAMGHGLAAAATAAIAVAAYRNARRRGLDLVGAYTEIDETLQAQFDDERFATAVLARLDLTTGSLRWVNAGHPPPLLIRDGRLVKVLSTPASTPLGVPLGTPPLEAAREGLQPGDRLLLYTDGITEARTADGKQFSAQRLVEFLERQSDPATAAPETLRRLRHAIMAYQHGTLQDDATVLLCEWRGGGEREVVPQTV